MTDLSLLRCARPWESSAIVIGFNGMHLPTSNLCSPNSKAFMQVCSLMAMTFKDIPVPELGFVASTCDTQEMHSTKEQQAVLKYWASLLCIQAEREADSKPGHVNAAESNMPMQ